MLFTLDTWVYILLGALAISGGVVALKAVQGRNVTPAVASVLKALEPFVYKAIFAGERALVWGFDQAESAIEATDKKKVADSVYDLLPEFIVVGTVPVPSLIIKRLVPREEFQTFVKNIYDETNAFLQRNEQYLKNQVDALRTGNTHSGAAA